MMWIFWTDDRQGEQWEDFTARHLIACGGDYWRDRGVTAVLTADGTELWVTRAGDAPPWLTPGIRSGKCTVTLIPDQAPRDELPPLCIRCASEIHDDPPGRLLCDQCMGDGGLASVIDAQQSIDRDRPPLRLISTAARDADDPFADDPFAGDPQAGRGVAW